MPYEVNPRYWHRNAREYGYTLLNLKPDRILDVGCGTGDFDYLLCCCDMKVTGIDAFNRSQSQALLSHPNYTFIFGDFLKMDFPENCFDSVVLLSTLEHIGMRAYGFQNTEIYKDCKAVDKISHVCKKDGVIIITTPYGLGGRDWWRSYQDWMLDIVLKPLEVLEIKYFDTRIFDWTTHELARLLTHGYYEGREISDGELSTVFIKARPNKEL
jgi:ubiquinone/menaquinone biosynthesis C-methylase UbiE